jgi:hypothetical protein
MSREFPEHPRQAEDREFAAWADAQLAGGINAVQSQSNQRFIGQGQSLIPWWNHPPKAPNIATECANGRLMRPFSWVMHWRLGGCASISSMQSGFVQLECCAQHWHVADRRQPQAELSSPGWRLFGAIFSLGRSRFLRIGF